VLIFTMPIWTLLLAWPILGERVRGRQWFAAASTLIGLVLIIEPWAMHSSLFSKFLGVTAALCWAIGTVLIKRLRARQQVDLLVLTMWQTVLGAAPLILLTLLVPERATEWNLSYIGSLAFMAVISTALGWWLWIYILDKVPAWEASLSVLGTPVVALISSRLVMGEEFKLSEMAGIVLIGSGLAMLSLIGWLRSRQQ
jgi:drug/metabolite transporter (DMT)-like permease